MPVIDIRNLDCHFSTASAMFDGVVQKVGDSVEEQILIAHHGQRSVSDQPQVCAPFFGCSLV